MSLDGFVRSAGAAMGLARESFGSGGVALAPAPGLGEAPTGFGAGSGRAADAFADESGVVGTNVAALSEHDQAGEQQVRDALSAAGVGRDRMEAVIAAAVADVQAMGASTNTEAGQRALVSAIKRHLEDTKATLDQADGDASTRAASANVTAAGYQGVGQQQPGGAAPPMGAAPQMPMMPQMPMPSMPMGGGMPMAPLTGLTSLLTGGRQPQAGGPYLDPAGQIPASVGGGGGGLGDRVVKHALSQMGVRYSWGGGNKNGPTAGSDGVGFDCSGLLQFAFGQEGVSVPRTTYELQHAGVAVPPSQARAGDILLCNYSSPGVPEHVKLIMSSTQTVEAPSRGSTVRIGGWPSGHFEVRRLVNG